MELPISNSWELIKKGARTLNNRPALWALPILDVIGRLALWGLVWCAVIMAVMRNGLFTAWVLLLIPAHFLASFIRSFFNIALAHGVAVRGEGARIIDESLRHANTMKWSIFKWSVLEKFVEIIVKSNFGGLFRDIVSSLGQMSWKLATLVVPVLISRGQAPMAAIDGSIKTVSKVFGTSAVGTAGVWGVFYLIQGAISFTGFLAIWGAVMKGYPVGGIALGLLTVLLVVAVRVYEGAVTTAFAVKLLQQYEINEQA